MIGIIPAERDADWRTEAMCAQTDPDIFFLDKGGDGGGIAKAFCKPCPVRYQCLRFAMEQGIDQGIFGGLSPNQRRKLRRNQGAS